MTDSKQFSEPGNEGQSDRDTLRIHLLAGGVFAFLYMLMQYDASLSALSVLALLPCILYRLETRQRRIGQAPLTLAALMLTQKMFTSRAVGGLPGMSIGPLAAPWLPLFLAVPLFYLPKEISHTRKMFMGLGVILLSSGLLPGSGFAAVFSLFQYVMPVGVAVTLCMDIFGRNKPWNVPGPTVPHEASQRGGAAVLQAPGAGVGTGGGKTGGGGSGHNIAPSLG